VRGEIKETEKKLLLEIEKVRADLSIEIARVQGRLLQWSFVFWLTQFAAIMALMWRLWPQAGG
ncbi:MAG: hypothetical protein N2Z63_02175, partial [Thiobacillaceae bacterium]|nr:hypothetical protein [Thiobacillaceae bacterium]